MVTLEVDAQLTEEARFGVNLVAVSETILDALTLEDNGDLQMVDVKVKI